MTDFQSQKDLVRALHAAIAGATPETVADAIRPFVSTDWHWRGMHPFNELYGPDAVAKEFYAPLMTAMPRLQRRPDIFIAGLNQIDDFQSTWVTQMGHFMGLLDKPWLGIPPTRRITMMRFVEFNRVVDGKITETAMFFDIPQVMIQAGVNQLPPQTGAHLIQPGPMTHEGLCWGPTDPALGEATLATINRMLGGMKESRDPDGPPVTDYVTHLRRHWHDDMIWWGPCGIGATYTVERYREQHGVPFRDALNQGYRFNGHIAKLAEGHCGGFFGWANLTVRNSGGYLGMTAGPGPSEMRVVDMYREQDGKLAENWIFIDILHYLALQGLDVLERMRYVNAGLHGY